MWVTPCLSGDPIPVDELTAKVAYTCGLYECQSFMFFVVNARPFFICLSPVSLPLKSSTGLCSNYGNLKVQWYFLMLKFCLVSFPLQVFRLFHPLCLGVLRHHVWLALVTITTLKISPQIPWQL